MIYFIPLIINIILMIFFIKNFKTKYNIYYILYVILMLFPIINIGLIALAPYIIWDQSFNLYKGDFKMKPTKLNKFLFGYEEGEDED